MLSSSITRSTSVVWLLCASCRSWDAAPTYSYDSKSGAASGAGRSRAGARRWVGSEEEDGGAWLSIQFKNFCLAVLLVATMMIGKAFRKVKK